MNRLEWPDTHHLNAAIGWLELGNYLEADAELDAITPQLRAHPHVLTLRWEIYSTAQRWDAALEIANALVQLVPDNAQNWVHRSFALHVLKRTLEARDLLLPAADRFPDGDLIRYNLGCYECQLGNLSEAQRWLKAAFALDDSKAAKLEALADPDLEPLWQHIGEL